MGQGVALFHQTNDELEDEIGRACSMIRRRAIFTGFWCENQKGKTQWCTWEDNIEMDLRVSV
jgi:hypothetical protein